MGQLFLTMAFAAGPPTRVSVVGLTQVLFVFALEQFWAPQPYNATMLLGMVLVLAPTGWVLWHGGRQRRTAVAAHRIYSPGESVHSEAEA